MSEQIVTIASYDNLFEAELAKGLLQESGIQVFLKNEIQMSIYPTNASKLYRLELQVSSESKDEALKILESFTDGTFTSELLNNMGALLEGHFLLTSGKHSGKYVEKIRILQNPSATAHLCSRIASRLASFEIDAIVGPAYGGIALAFEVARNLEKAFIFTQRKDEQMVIRSGFNLDNVRRVAVVEDIVTTGGSVFEVIECLKSKGITVEAVAALVDRSGGSVDFGVPFESLLQLEIKVWEANDCELCSQGIPLVKPGASDKKIP